MKTHLNELFWLKRTLMLLKAILFIIASFFVATPQAYAAITTATTWTNIYHNSALPGTIATQFSVAAGSNRMLVVALSYEASSSNTLTATSVTYGGVTMTAATANDAGTSLSMHALIYYLKDNAVMDGTNKSLVVNITGGGTAVMQNVWYSVYTGVDQAATPVSQNYNSAGSAVTSAAFATALSTPIGNQAVLVGAAARATATVTVTDPTNWTTNNNQASGTTGRGIVATFNGATTTTTAPYTFTSCRWSQTGLSMAPAPVPTITSLGSSSGCVGSSLVINGTNLSGASSASIGGTAATITGNTSTTVTVTVGTGTTGTVAVTTAGGTATSAATFTVIANNTVGAASSSPTPCINTLMTNITHATTGATGIGTATGLPEGVTAAWATNTITISGTPTASGTFYYSVPLTGGCGSVINATGTIVVNPIPVTSIPVDGQVNITCFNGSDGSITIQATGGTSPYQFSVDGGATWTSGSNPNPYIFGNLSTANNPYRVKVKDANGCISK